MSSVVVPLGRIDADLLQHVQQRISTTFRRSVLQGRARPVPASAYEPSRKQYLATALVGWLQHHTEDLDHERMLGVIDQDLYVPELNFVFGVARDRVAVMSLTRLRQEFYGLPADRLLFQQRAVTEALHELGHTYGLPHCTNPRCVMRFSNTLEDTDKKGTVFCATCRRKLR
jgi:archaemetzincin